MLHIPFGQSRGCGPGGVSGEQCKDPGGTGGSPAPQGEAPGPPPPMPPYGLGGVELILFCLFKYGLRCFSCRGRVLGGCGRSPAGLAAGPGGGEAAKRGQGTVPVVSPRGRGLRGFLGAGGPRPEGRQRPSPPRGWPKGLPRCPPLPPSAVAVTVTAEKCFFF